MKKVKQFLLLILIACGPLAAAEKDAHAKPNVIVMIADDLGSGDLSCLFRDVVKTPNIDRLAARGVKFTSGYVTAPLCGPSRAGFFTGQYPQGFGFTGNEGGIPTTLPLLPGVLRNEGYHMAVLEKTDDPRLTDAFDKVPYVNPPAPAASRKTKGGKGSKAGKKAE